MKKLPDDALEHLRKALIESNICIEEYSDDDIEELAFLLLNLTAAAIKTREKLRMMGKEIPASRLESMEEKRPTQGVFRGLEN